MAQLRGAVSESGACTIGSGAGTDLDSNFKGLPLCTDCLLGRLPISVTQQTGAATSEVHDMVRVASRQDAALQPGCWAAQAIQLENSGERTHQGPHAPP